MQLKTFKSRSMSEALAAVKADLGPDAVILNTRTVRQGGVMGVGSRNIVEITASRDAGSSRPNDRPTPGPAPVSLENAVSRVSQPAAGDRARELRMPVSSGDPTAATVDPAVRREIEEIRGMVDELLRDSRRTKTPSIPDELIDYYAQLISQDVANQLASDIVTRLHQRLEDDQTPAAGREGKEQAATHRCSVGRTGSTPRPTWQGQGLRDYQGCGRLDRDHHDLCRYFN